MGEAIMPIDSLIQPFRRNLTVPVIIGPVGLTAQPVSVQDMTSKGVTSFVISNPNPFYMWFAGWRGAVSDMPAIKENGHYLHPGEKYLRRTQMPQWVAAVADDEPGASIFDAQGNWAFQGKRTRFVLVYGSGA